MEKEIVIGKYTLESLTRGMYSNPLDLYREYIQNAVDSIDNAKEIYKEVEYYISIEIDELEGSIAIKDNGTGISQKNAGKILVDIGNSEKDKKKARGFRGIGRLAGLGYSDELSFVTSCEGEAVKTIVHFNTKLLKRLLYEEDKNIISVDDVMQEIVEICEEVEEKEKHYFKVLLEGIEIKEKLLDAKIVENYLVQCAPLPYDREFVWGDVIKKKFQSSGYIIPEYKIVLNGKKLYKPYHNTFICDRVKRREETVHDVDVLPFYREDKLTGILWYGVTGYCGTILDNTIKGIRIRQGNILIGDKTTCNKLFKEERFNGWLMGEFYIIDPEMIVNARRDYFEENEAHYDFSENFLMWSTKIIKEIKKISYSKYLLDKQYDDFENKNLRKEKIHSECDLIKKEENEEITILDKFSWLINDKEERKTKYLALNMKDNLTLVEKKTLEKTFDIIIGEYTRKDAEKIINIIINKI